MPLSSAVFFFFFFFFPKSTFSKSSFSGTIRVSNSFDPDQVQHFVGTDLGPNCLQRLSADHTSRQRDNLNGSILKGEKKL